ncbi:MAG: hypothetical protein GX434_15930 [Peptococcaceae bacterium]|nr:hypothetical protein [Peptococcaceae bacterium]
MKHRIIEVNADGTYQVVAGGKYKENNGYLEGSLADGKGEEAKFNEPVGLAIGSDGTVYVADSGNQRIRAIAADKSVTTIAGSEMIKLLIPIISEVVSRTETAQPHPLIFQPVLPLIQTESCILRTATTMLSGSFPETR